MKLVRTFPVLLLISAVLNACADSNPQNDGGLASSYAVSGTITGASLSGVKLTLDGGSPADTQTATSDGGGAYTFAQVKPGSYRIQPTQAGYLFSPEFRDFEVKSAAVTVNNFVSIKDPFTCTDSTGTWCRPVPAVSETINRIWAPSNSDLWFVGNGGTVVRYTSSTAGQPKTWTRLIPGTTTNLYAIWGSSSKDVWVGGEVIAENIRDTSGVYMYTEYKSVYHYVEGATPSWSSYPSRASIDDINVLWGFSASGDIRFGGCYMTTGLFPTDGGDWTIGRFPNIARIYGAYAASAADEWVVGRVAGSGKSGPQGATSAVGKMYRQQNDGGWKEAGNANLKLWSAELETAAGAGAWFSDIQGTSATDIWAVGTKGLVAHYDGKQWGLVDAGVTANLYGVWPVSATEVWVAGGEKPSGATTDQPKLYRYTNVSGKATWQPISPPSDAGTLYRVWLDSASGEVWLTGTTGILRYRP